MILIVTMNNYFMTILTLFTTVSSDVNVGVAGPDGDACSFDNTKHNIRINCHKRKVNSIDAGLNPNNYYPFILPIDEQTYSVYCKAKCCWCCCYTVITLGLLS